jgi:hypothetical protein
LWMNPCEVVKQRKQMKGSPYINKSYPHMIKEIFRTEGFRAFYLSLPTQLSMNVPFAFLQFGIYDIVKKHLNPRNDYSPGTNAVSGAVAGGIAAFITTPLDVMKTVLNTQENLTATNICNPCPRTDCKVYKQSYVSGITSAFRQVRQQGGLRPFFRGCLARVVVLAPGCALSWLAYEFMKTCLGAQNSQQRKSDKG